MTSPAASPMERLKILINENRGFVLMFLTEILK